MLIGGGDASGEDYLRGTNNENELPTMMELTGETEIFSMGRVVTDRRTRVEILEEEKRGLEEELGRAERQVEALREIELDFRSHFVEVTAALEMREAGLRLSERRAEELAEQVKRLERGGRGGPGGGDGDSILAIRLARDAAHQQIVELNGKVSGLEDEVAALGYERGDAVERSERAEVVAVEWEREVVALRREVKGYRETLAVGSAEEWKTLLAERDEAWKRLGEMELELEGLRVLGVEKTNEKRESHSEKGGEVEVELAVMRRRFEGQRLEMIEMATRLQNALGEIREMSVGLAEARIQMKLVRDEVSGRKSGWGGDAGTLLGETRLAVGDGRVEREEALRNCLGALRQSWGCFEQNVEDGSFLGEMYAHGSEFCRLARDGGYVAMERLGERLCGLVREMYESSEVVEGEILRTVGEAVEMLERLRMEGSGVEGVEGSLVAVIGGDDVERKMVEVAMVEGGMRVKGEEGERVAATLWIGGVEGGVEGERGVVVSLEGMGGGGGVEKRMGWGGELMVRVMVALLGERVGG